MDNAFLKELTNKLVASGITKETANRFSRYYKLGPELKFEDDVMPSDDCFETLRIINHLFYTEAEIDVFEIRKFLSIPYRDIENSKKAIINLFSEHKNDIETLYEKEKLIYYVKQNDITAIYKLISEYVEGDMWDVFVKAVLVGYDIADERLKAVKSAVPQQLLSKAIFESAKNGFLFYQYYNDPVAAISFLKDKFSKEVIADILINERDILYLFKEECYAFVYGQKEAINKHIDDILNKYKQ